MTDRPVPTARELVAWVRDDFGLRLASCERAGGGTDAAASTWRATTDDGARVAVRVTAGRATGVWLATMLALRGVRGVPTPWRTADGAAWSVRDGRRLSVASWVSDRAAAPGRMTAGQWRALGHLLAQVHAQPVGDALAVLPREDLDPTTWVRRARDLPWTIVRQPGADGVTSAVAGALVGALEPLARVADAAERLAGPLADRFAGAPPRTVLCHGDPDPTNVLLGEDDVWLVDWDDALVAPPERDLLLVVGGVLTAAPASAEERGWFAEGYGRLDVDDELVRYLTCARALEQVVSLADVVLDQDADRARREDAARTLRVMLATEGIGRLADATQAAP